MAMKKKPKKKTKAKSRPKAGVSTFIRLCILLVLAGMTVGSIYLLKNPGIVPDLSNKKDILPSKTASFPSHPAPVKEKSVMVNLYFSDPYSDNLARESRKVIWKVGDIKDQMRVIVEELLKGPESDLFKTIPSRVVIRDISLKENGIGVINFSRQLSLNHPGGSLAEMHTIYSIVNSLLLNISSLKQIQILVEGKAPETLKGHIDCRTPFKANLAIIKTG